VVEVAEIGCVNWCAGKEGGRKRRKCLSRIFNNGGGWLTITPNKVGTVSSGFHNFVRATFAVRQLSNFASGRITNDLDAGHNKIANSVGNGRARFICAFAMGCTAFFG
jgi:hypothetical protein